MSSSKQNPAPAVVTSHREKKTKTKQGEIEQLVYQGRSVLRIYCTPIFSHRHKYFPMQRERMRERCSIQKTIVATEGHGGRTTGRRMPGRRGGLGRRVGPKYFKTEQSGFCFSAI